MLPVLVRILIIASKTIGRSMSCFKSAKNRSPSMSACDKNVNLNQNFANKKNFPFRLLENTDICTIVHQSSRTNIRSSQRRRMNLEKDKRQRNNLHRRSLEPIYYRIPIEAKWQSKNAKNVRDSRKFARNFRFRTFSFSVPKTARSSRFFNLPGASYVGNDVWNINNLPGLSDD